MCLKNLKLLFLSLVLLSLSWVAVSQDISLEQSHQENQVKLSNNSKQTTSDYDKKTKNSNNNSQLPSDLQKNLTEGLTTQSVLLTQGLDCLTILDTQLETLETQFQTLESQLETSKSTIMELKKSLTESKQIVENLQIALNEANKACDTMAIVIDGQDDYFLYLNKEFERLNKRINLGSGMGMCFGGIAGTALGTGVMCLVHKEYGAGAGLIGGSIVTFSIWSICHFAFKIF